jgi:RNase P subunit RPR2
MAKLTYVQLLQLRKTAVLAGDRKLAKEYLQKARALSKKREVDEDDYIAGAYT